MSSPKTFITDGSTVSHELAFRGIKILDISYTVSIYIIFASVCAHFTEKYFAIEQDNLKKISSEKLYLYTIFQMSLMAIVMYIVRNIVEQIPYPLNGAYGYDHYKLTELKSGSLFAAVYIFSVPSLKNKFNEILFRFSS